MILIHSFPGFQIALSEKSDGDFSNRSHFPHFLRPEEQVHGRDIHTITRGNRETLFTHSDGVYTQEKGIWIGSLTADCPILHIVGIGECASVHSGWRGTKARIVEHALARFTTERKHIQVFICPHIRVDSYEVGEDFLPHFPREYFHFGEEKIYFDLEGCLYDSLLQLGILREHIVSYGSDTYTDLRFQSYRRDRSSERAFFGIKVTL